MNIKNLSKSNLEFIIFLFLVCGFLFLSIINNENKSVIHVFYSCFCIGLLMFLVYLSRSDLIHFFLAMSFFLYFYQVPFLFLIPDSRHAVYNIVYDQWAAYEFYLMMSFVIVSFSVIFYIFVKFVNAQSHVKIMKKHLAVNSGTTFWASFIFAFLIVISGIIKSGGFYSYIALDKFEADQAASFMFLSYKFFVLMMSVSCFSTKRLSVGKLIIILLFIILELLNAKRFLVMGVGVLFFLLRFEKISLSYILGFFLSVFFVNFLKYIYYSLPHAIFTGTSNFWGSVFYFTVGDFLTSSLFIGEFAAHLRLSYLNIYHHISYEIMDFINLMLAGIPFSNSLLGIHYESVGEMFRIYVGEPWAGLASSVYIMPYLSLSFLGVFFIYISFFLTFYLVLNLGRKNILFSLISLSLLPLFTFYFNREPFLLIGKSIFLMSSSAILVLSLSFLLRFLISSLLEISRNGATRSGGA